MNRCRALPIMRRHLHAWLIVLIRAFISVYLQHAPCKFGKRKLYELYKKHIAWMPYRRTIRTQSGLKMCISMPDFVSETIYLTGKWEPLITHYVERTLKDGDIFIDVGANIGYYSLIASKFVGPNGAVIAIEASPTIYERLLKNISLNDVSKSRVRAINAAAASCRGELALYIGPRENLGHSTTVEGLAHKCGMQFEAKVMSDRLEELVGTKNLFGARLIKIDVEGAERVVLEPYLNRLREFSSDTEWLIELVPGQCGGGQRDVDAVFDAFTSNGYAAYSFPDWRDPNLRLSRSVDKVRLTCLVAPPTGELNDILMTRREFA